METNFSFGSLGLDEVPAIGPMEAGDYLLMVLAAGQHTGKTGKLSIKIVLGFADHIEGQDFQHYLSLPGEGDDERQSARKLSRIKDFIDAIGLDYSSSTNDWVNAQFNAAVLLEESEEYGAQNRLGRLLGG